MQQKLPLGRLRAQLRAGQVNAKPIAYQETARQVRQIQAEIRERRCIRARLRNTSACGNGMIS